MDTRRTLLEKELSKMAVQLIQQELKERVMRQTGEPDLSESETLVWCENSTMCMWLTICLQKNWELDNGKLNVDALVDILIDQMWYATRSEKDIENYPYLRIWLCMFPTFWDYARQPNSLGLLLSLEEILAEPLPAMISASKRRSVFSWQEIEEHLKFCGRL